MDEEKRIYPRTEAKWPVSAITAEGMIQGETKNITLNGAFICCKKVSPTLAAEMSSSTRQVYD